MTDTQQTQSAPPRRSLHRSRQDSILAGVSAGLGEHFAINAWWFRWAFIVLAFFGGFGVLLYVLAWIFIPAEGEPHTAAQRWLESLDLTDTGTILGVVLIGVAAIVIATQVINIPGSLVFAAVLFSVGILLYRGDLARGTTDDGPATTDDSSEKSQVASSKSEDPAEKSEVRSQKSGTDTLPADNAGGVPASLLVSEDISRDSGGDVKPPMEKKVKEPKAPKPPRESSMLGRITIAVALIVLSGMALLEASGITIGSHESGDLFDPIHYAATGLAIVGIGLIVGAFIGRARWLIIIGLLVLPLVFVSSVWPRSFDWTAGDRYFSPTTAEQVQAEYSHGAGRLVLDLSGLSPDELGDVGEVTVTLGAGDASITIPSGAGVRFIGHVGLGQIEIIEFVADEPDNSTDISDRGSFLSVKEQVIDSAEGVNSTIDRPLGPSPYSFTLDVEVGAGRLQLYSIERTSP